LRFEREKEEKSLLLEDEERGEKGKSLQSSSIKDSMTGEEEGAIKGAEVKNRREREFRFGGKKGGGGSLTLEGTERSPLC